MYYDNSVQFYNHVRFCLHHSIRTYLCKCVRNNCIQDLMASTTDWYLFDKSVYCNIYIKLSSGNTCFGYVLWHVSSRPFRWAAIIWPWITSHSLLRAFLSAKIFCWNQLNISIQGNITIQLNVCFKEIALQKESNFDVTSFDVIFASHEWPMRSVLTPGMKHFLNVRSLLARMYSKNSLFPDVASFWHVVSSRLFYVI